MLADLDAEIAVVGAREGGDRCRILTDRQSGTAHGADCPV
jgi:hypothetical protein